jgi:hypothetical protein
MLVVKVRTASTRRVGEAATAVPAGSRLWTNSLGAGLTTGISTTFSFKSGGRPRRELRCPTDSVWRREIVTMAAYLVQQGGQPVGSIQTALLTTHASDHATALAGPNVPTSEFCESHRRTAPGSSPSHGWCIIWTLDSRGTAASRLNRPLVDTRDPPMGRHPE